MCSLFIGLNLIGCSSDDDETGAGGSSGGNTPTGGGGTPTAGTNGGGSSNPCMQGGKAGAGKNKITGTLKDSVTTTNTLSGMTLKVLDNETGADLGISTTSGSDGSFTLDGLPDGFVGIEVVGTDTDPARIDTYTYNVATNATNRDIFSTLAAISDFITNALKLTEKPTTSPVSGGVYYFDKNCNEWPVGCATVKVSDSSGQDSGKMYYFDATKRLPDETLTETSTNGLFLAIEIPPGTATMRAFVGGAEVSDPDYPTVQPIVAGNDASTTKKAVTHISRVYVKEQALPAGACELSAF